MSEEIKERLEKLRREYRPSMAGDVCLSWAADVAPALSEALALITSLTAELTAARGEVDRLQDDLTEYRLAVTEMDSLAAGPGGLVAPLATLKKIAAIGERALTPAEEGPRIVEGARMPYFCPACQAIPKHGYCNLPGCLTRPAEEGGTGMSESEAWSEADCLAYDPFAGDDYGNDFVDFGAKIVNGRKVYQCHICQGPIAKGERHRVDSCILDGERLHARFCGICCAAMAISSEDGGEAITAREPEFQPPLLDDPLMTTPDLEGLARERLGKLVTLLESGANVTFALSTAYHDPDAEPDDEADALHADLCAILHSPAPAPGREEIARIIDPSAWTTLDMLYAELVQRGGKPNPARFKDGWSLDKADAILALFHAPAEAGGGEAEKKLCPECQGTGLQRIEGLYDDCPKCDGDGLVSPSPTPPAGDGWRMVPSGDMSPAMCDAALAYIDGLSTEIQFRLPGGFNWHDLYRAMIAAAPPPPVSKEPG